MPGKVEIMRKVQEHLNELEVAKDESDEVWTKEVKTKLCKIGRRLGYSAYAKKNEVDSRYRDGANGSMTSLGSNTSAMAILDADLSYPPHPWWRSANGATSGISTMISRSFFWRGRTSG